jgi:hypothetical protein
VQADVDGTVLEEKTPEALMQPIVEVPKVEETVRAFVANFGGKPMICQEQGKKAGKELEENLKRLKAILKPVGIALEHPLEDTVLIQAAKEACLRNPVAAAAAPKKIRAAETKGGGSK